MSDFLNKTLTHDTDLRFEMKISLNLSIGVFLFILFLQPFEYSIESFNNRLLFVSGFGGITLIFMSLFQIIMPRIFKKSLQASVWESGPPIITNILVWVFNSVAFTFYLRYVGSMHISIYLAFKIILICLAPVIIVQVLYKEKFQKFQIQNLHDQNKKLQVYIKENREKELSDDFEIVSENRSEKIKLQLRDLLLIKSADNYVEVHYKVNDEINKKLIRNTLKNILSELDKFPSILRCHRTCVVNSEHIEKLEKHFNGYMLKLQDLKEEVPVSRQYLLRVRDVIKE